MSTPHIDGVVDKIRDDLVNPYVDDDVAYEVVETPKTELQIGRTLHSGTTEGIPVDLPRFPMILITDEAHRVVFAAKIKPATRTYRVTIEATVELGGDDYAVTEDDLRDEAESAVFSLPGDITSVEADVTKEDY